MQPYANRMAMATLGQLYSNCMATIWQPYSNRMPPYANRMPTIGKLT